MSLIPGSSLGFLSSGELFHGMNERGVHMVSLSTCCLRRKPLNSVDHRPGEAHHTINGPDIAVNGIKLKKKTTISVKVINSQKYQLN